MQAVIGGRGQESARLIKTSELTYFKRVTHITFSTVFRPDRLSRRAPPGAVRASRRCRPDGRRLGAWRARGRSRRLRPSVETGHPDLHVRQHAEHAGLEEDAPACAARRVVLAVCV